MKTFFKNNICFDNFFRTRMDFKFIHESKILKILMKPNKWQIVEFTLQNKLIKNHIVGAIVIDKIHYENSLKILNNKKKTLINGDFFEMTFFYHYLKNKGFNVYLLKNKPNIFKYKKPTKS